MPVNWGVGLTCSVEGVERGAAQVDDRCEGRASKNSGAPIWPAPVPYPRDRLCLDASGKGQALSQDPREPYDGQCRYRTVTLRPLVLSPGCSLFSLFTPSHPLPLPSPLVKGVRCHAPPPRPQLKLALLKYLPLPCLLPLFLTPTHTSLLPPPSPPPTLK